LTIASVIFVEEYPRRSSRSKMATSTNGNMMTGL
jgi:hypothetical protein